jgi:hypothetical protein
MLINVSSARWLVSKFAEKRIFESLYKMLIRFAYTVGLALLGSVRGFLFVVVGSVESLFKGSGVN